MAQKENQATITGTCCFPTAEHPFYHIRLSFSLNEGERYQIKRVQVNGVRVREFEPFHNARFLKDQMLEGGGHSELVLRWNWKSGEESAVEATGEAEQGKKPLTLKARITASTYGGYWDPAWKYYASFVCSELAGIDRFDEPVHAGMAVYSDRIQDPEKELRIVAVDPVSGAHREVPCQVHEVRHFTAEGLSIGEEYQPTTTFQVAFFADVPAYSSRV